MKKLWQFFKKAISGKPLLYTEKEKAKWDQQFELGIWDFMLQSPQIHTPKIGELIIKRGLNHAVLDYASGNGGLTQVLRANKFPRGKYLGVDLSTVAIANAQKNNPEYKFITTEEFWSQNENKYDIIVLSEVLYCLNYKDLMPKLEKYLQPGGVFIVSVYKSWRSTLILWYLKNRYKTEELYNITNQKTSWTIIILKMK